MSEEALGSIADKAADSYGIPPALFRSLIAKESSWNMGATGTSGEYGLTQLMKGTASDLGVNRYNPRENLAGGAKYLSQQFKRFGNWRDALSAYNAGAGNIQAGRGYADDVLAKAGMSASGASAGLSVSDVLGALTGRGLSKGLEKAFPGNPVSKGIDSLPINKVLSDTEQESFGVKEFFAKYGLWALAIILLIFAIWRLIK